MACVTATLVSLVAAWAGSNSQTASLSTLDHMPALQVLAAIPSVAQPGDVLEVEVLGIRRSLQVQVPAGAKAGPFRTRGAGAATARAS